MERFFPSRVIKMQYKLRKKMVDFFKLIITMFTLSIMTGIIKNDQNV